MKNRIQTALPIAAAVVCVALVLLWRPRQPVRDNQSATTNPMAQEVPKLEVDRVEHDFGVLQPGDRSITVFHIRNSGAAALKLEAPRSNSGALLPQFSSLTVKPKAAAELKVVMTAPTTPGPFNGQIMFKSDAPGNPDTTLRIIADVSSAVTATPQTVDFGKVKRGVTAQKVVRIASTTGKPIRISKVHVSTAGFTISDFDKSREAPALTIPVQVKPTTNSVMRGSLRVDLALPNETIRVPLIAQPAGLINPAPARIDFVAADRVTPQKRRLLLRSNTPFTITSAKILGGPFIATVEAPGKSDRRHFVRIDLNLLPNDTAMAFKGSLQVMTNLEDTPLTIPVAAKVLPRQTTGQAMPRP